MRRLANITTELSININYSYSDSFYSKECTRLFIEDGHVAQEVQAITTKLLAKPTCQVKYQMRVF